MSTQRGVALLLALWVIALLSIMLGGLAVSVQLQQKQAQWLSNQTRASLVAQAGLSLAVAGLMRDAPDRWQADGKVHEASLDDHRLRISIRSERGKLDLNSASGRDIGKVLASCGASLQQAEVVTRALEARRDELPLRMLEEFRELPGVTFGQYACALPLITLWSGIPQPDPLLAPPALARALGLPRPKGAPADAGQILTVTSNALLTNGFRARLRVTLVLLPTQAGTKPYRVLRWQE